MPLRTEKALTSVIGLPLRTQALQTARRTIIVSHLQNGHQSGGSTHLRTLPKPERSRNDLHRHQQTATIDPRGRVIVVDYPLRELPLHPVAHS